MTDSFLILFFFLTTIYNINLKDFESENELIFILLRLNKGRSKH
jgi:hypothetical protein